MDASSKRRMKDVSVLLEGQTARPVFQEVHYRLRRRDLTPGEETELGPGGVVGGTRARPGAPGTTDEPEGQQRVATQKGENLPVTI
jgi:hypothetical protein